jgi:hypothetical protein
LQGGGVTDVQDDGSGAEEPPDRERLSWSQAICWVCRRKREGDRVPYLVDATTTQGGGGRVHFDSQGRLGDVHCGWREHEVRLNAAENARVGAINARAGRVGWHAS